jgi:Xaa-Pro aminopeptidase
MPFDKTKARKMMSEAGLDALVATSPENVYYSTDSNIITMWLIRRLAFFVFPLDGDPVFGVSRIEESKARNTAWIKDIRIYEGGDWEPIKSIEFLSGLIEDKGLTKSKIGLDTQYLSAKLFNSLQGMLPDVTFVDNQMIFDKLRAVKTDDELKRLSDAAMATAKAITIAFQMAKEGDTERDIAQNMSNLVVEYGADNVAFCVLGAGKSNFEAHHLPIDKKIRRGELVHTDFGANFDGYYSDISRTAIVGKEPNRDQKRAYDLAIENMNNVVDAMRPGATVMEVHNVSKKTIEDAGLEYRRAFIGHSIGVGIHDLPFIGPAFADWVLEPNMVFEIEPGVRIGNARVHTEDTIQVTNGKAKNLSQFIDTSEMLIIK